MVFASSTTSTMSTRCITGEAVSRGTMTGGNVAVPIVTTLIWVSLSISGGNIDNSGNRFLRINSCESGVDSPGRD